MHSEETFFEPDLADKHVDLVRSMWREKKGDLLQELCHNLRQPGADGEEACSLTVGSLAAVSLRLQAEHGAKSLNPEVQRHPLAVACWVLYTMTDVDIDRLLGFECPELPPGMESPKD